MKKRLLSTFLIFSMLLTMVPINAGATEETATELAEQTAASLPQVEFTEGLPYVGFTSEQGKIPENSVYSLTLSRTGDTSVGSDVVVSTVDISAAYGKDYVIEVTEFTTVTNDTNGTVLEQSADEENRIEAQEELEKIYDQLSNSSSEVGESTRTQQIDTNHDGELSLAEMKALQSGKNVRNLSESDFHSLKEEFLDKLDVDIPKNVEASSQTHITFLPNEQTKTLTFRVLEDKESEGEEIFNFLLSADDDHTAIIEANTSVSFIIEDDEPIEHSVVTLTAEQFTADDGILTVTASRENAEYSYTTVGLKLTGNGSNSDENRSYELAFQPYQTEVSADIPVTQDSEEHTLTLELYDLKGCNEGKTMKAQAVIPVAKIKTDTNEPSDSYLKDFVSKSKSTAPLTSGAGPGSINIAGIDCTIEYDSSGKTGKIINSQSQEIGEYIVADDINDFRVSRVGSGDFTAIATDDNGASPKHIQLKYYSSWPWNKGYTSIERDINNPYRYRAVMADISTASGYPSAKAGARLSAWQEKIIPGLRSLSGDTSSSSSVVRLSEVSSFQIGDKNTRAARLGLTMFNKQGNDYIPCKSIDDKAAVITYYVERTESGFTEPDANIYGYALLYREYRIKVEQPDKLSFRNGVLNADGTPKKEDRLPASVSSATSETRYYGEPIQFEEAPASGNSCIYGELKGYNITPLNGKTFFQPTNNKELVLDDNLIKKIDENTNTIQKGAKMDSNEYLGYTTLTIKPVYGYKNVRMTLSEPQNLPENIKYQYLDKDLESMHKNKIKTTDTLFHIGDVINLSMELEDKAYYVSGYDRKQYANLGDADSAFDRNCSGEITVGETSPVLEIVRPKCIVGATVSNVPNHISIEMDSLAKKYFTVSNLLPQEELKKLTFAKGKDILAISDTNGGTGNKITPVTDRVYTIELNPTGENDGTWRPVFTLAPTGQKVNGFVADIMAHNNYKSNIVKISAEKYDPSKYEYFSIDGSACYSSYSLRPGSESVRRSPAMQCTVSAGGSVRELYKGSGNSATLGYSTIRYSAATNSEGKFSIKGIRAIDGDVISVIVDNNDIQQVKYIELQKPVNEAQEEHQDSCLRTDSFDELVADKNTHKNVNKRVKTECSLINAAEIDMPIRTQYSPYIKDVTFGYRDTYVSPYATQIPIYENDELSFGFNVVKNGCDIVGVVVEKIASNGRITEYDATKYSADSDSNEQKFLVTVNGSELSALDKFYVRLNAVPQGKNTTVAYPSLYTGFEMYSPTEIPPAQYLDYEIPSPYDDLPILGDMTGDLNAGTLNWTKVYADEENKGTSPYAHIVTLSVSYKDAKEKSEKLRTYSGGVENEGSKTWDDMIDDNESDVYKYLDSATQQQVYEKYKEKHPKATKEEAIEYLNTHKEAKESYKEQIKEGLKKDGLSKLGEKEIDFRVSVLVQLEYNYNPEKNTHYYSGGQYVINTLFSVDKTFYWTVFGLPVYLNVKGEITLQFDGRYTTDEEEITAQEMGYYENLADKVKTEWPYVQIGVGVTLQPGIGLCGILGARGMFKFAFVGRFNTDVHDFGAKGGSMGTFTGGVAVDLALISFEYDLGSADFWSPTGCFKKENKSAKQSSASSSAKSSSEENISLRAFDNGEEYRSMMLRSTFVPSAKTTLINGAMEYVRPQLVELGDGRTMFLFLRNMSGVADRDKSNASTLVYAIRKADGTWDKDFNNNIASAVVENDTMADSTFAAMKSGDKVYIAWTNANVTEGFEDNIESAKTILQSSNIHMAVFDIPTETMGKPFEVTNDKFVNSDVILAQEENNIALYYFKKDISTTEELKDIAGLSNNYNTWARKVYDPAQSKFIAVAKGKTNPEEELIMIDHPLIEDAMVTDLSAADYRYTDKKNQTRDYRFYSYTVDRDGNLETANDRELWLRVTNLTDNRDYYPIPIDAGKKSILSPKLTKIEDDVYLTWLSNGCIYNAISANTIFGGLDEVRGTGIYAENNGLDMIYSLSAEQIAQSGWYKLPYAALESASSETQGALYKLSRCDFENNQKNFGEIGADGEPEGSTLTDHQLVAGGDGNLYLFWTEQPNNDVKYDTGRELYGAALYRGEITESASSQNYSGWSDAVQLTEYNKVIDELTVSVNSNKGAVLIGNIYSQEIDENGSVVYGNHELAEIVFVPGDSLKFSNEGIVLSDEYPVEGEKVRAAFAVTNNGLLPAEKYNLTVNDKTATIEEQSVYPGGSADFSTEFIVGKDGSLTLSAEVEELDNSQKLAVNDYQSKRTEVSTKSGAVLEFGSPAIYTIEDVCEYLDANSVSLLPDLTEKENIDKTLESLFAVSEPKDERLKAVIADCVTTTVKSMDNSEYYVCVPVTNIGNLPAKNLEVYADSDKNTYGAIVNGECSLVPVKTVDSEGNAVTETVYLVARSSLYSGLTDAMNDKGVFHFDLHFRLDGQELDETVVAEKQILNNQLLEFDNIENNSCTIKQGETLQIETTAYPWNGLKKLVYDVEPVNEGEETTVTVTSDGLISGVKVGESVVYVTDTSSGTESFIFVDVVDPDSSKVTFDSGEYGIAYGMETKDIYVKNGKTVSEPDIPLMSMYAFEGWYTDKKFTKPFDFNTPITENITLYAKWWKENPVDIEVGKTFYEGDLVNFGNSYIVTNDQDGNIEISTTYEELYIIGKPFYDSEYGQYAMISANDDYIAYVTSENYGEDVGFKVTGGDGTIDNPFTFAVVKSEKVMHTVAFNTNGHGTAPATLNVEDGKTISEQPVLSESGWIFGGWYIDDRCTTLFDFSTPITEDMVLYAKWTEEAVTPTEPPTETTSEKPTAISTETASAKPIESPTSKRTEQPTTPTQPVKSTEPVNSSQQNTSSGKSVPSTTDSTDAIIWTAIMITSWVSMIMLYRRKKKRHYK